MGPIEASAFALTCLDTRAILSRYTGVCAICSAETTEGWPRSELSSAFAEGDKFRAPHSDIICPACRHFAVGSTWQEHARAHPELGIKMWAQASWRSYSHMFSTIDGVSHPGPGRWRSILDTPPLPPFLAIISETARKNLISFGIVATSTDRFPVLFETTTIWLYLEHWRACVSAFETLRAMGFTRDDVLSGHYHQPLVMQIGVRRVREADASLKRWRRDEPDMMRLVHYTSTNAGRPPC